MAQNNFTEFKLPKNAYTAFDATSMKQLMINRLKESNLFTDVDFEGSNISGLVDVIAYTYHVLLFYLNQTASETLFTQTDLIENMNKIVSLLNYNVRGATTAQLKVDVTAKASLPKGSYYMRRFSHCFFQNIRYSIVNDIAFEKSTNNEELIKSIGESNLLYQGTIKEYPLYTALGEDFEEVVVNIDYNDAQNQNKFIDTNNIFVYIKSIETNKWEEVSEVSNIFLARELTYFFEKKLNEFGHYQLKFGNGYNGKKLTAGDTIAIFYLESDGNLGIVGTNITTTGAFTPYTTALFEEIMKDVSAISYMSVDELVSIKFNNPYSSIPPTDGESIEDIRNNTPLLFAIQNRLVTANDYSAFVKRTFSSIIRDVSVASNEAYTSEFLNYFYSIGLDRPNMDVTVLMNQIKFRNACDFNNVYLFCVPNIPDSADTPITLFDAQKQLILDAVQDLKVINQNIVLEDPVYIAFALGIPPLGKLPDSDISENTLLTIYKNKNTLYSKDSIKEKVATAITDFFNWKNNNLGQMVDLSDLNLRILSIEGIEKIEIQSTVDGEIAKTNKLSFVYWNPLYPSINPEHTIQNVKLEYFKFPYLYNKSGLLDKITVI